MATSTGSSVTTSENGQDGPERAKRRQLSDRALAKVFMAPSMITMTVIALFPVLYAAILSLYLYSGRQRIGFGGLENFTTALTNPRFWDAIQFTFVFTATSVVGEFLIGLGFALLMNQAFVGRGVTRAVILVPWVIPTVIAAQMWFFMFNVTPGFVNSVLATIGFSGFENFNWLGQPGTAPFTVIFADVWKTAPFVALLLLAGLQTIPGEVYESARVDGANAFQRFWSITLPLLKPAILVALLFRTVDALRVFDLPQVMTQGAFGTESVSILVQRFIVQTPNPGLGSALSTLTFIIVLGVGLIFVSLLGKDLVIGSEEG
jgi:multiple sugar transport system permease protein